MDKHTCFYSNKCLWSKAFLEELATTPWKSTFKFVCVDPGKERPTLPAWLKKVPSLVIAGESEPRTDGDVMNWISEMRMKQSSGVKQVSSSEPEAFNTLEHSSFARGFGYSFQDADTSTGGNGGQTIPGAFSFLNGAAASATSVSDRSALSEKKTKKESQLDQALEAYQQERNRGVPQSRPAL